MHSFRGQPPFQQLQQEQAARVADFRVVVQGADAAERPADLFQRLDLVTALARARPKAGGHVQAGGEVAVARAGGHAAQELEPARREPDLLRQFPGRRFGGLFPGIDPALDEPQFVTVKSRGVFPHQDQGIVLHGRHHDHPVALVAQALEGGALAVAETHFEGLDPEEPRLGHQRSC